MGLRDESSIPAARDNPRWQPLDRTRRGAIDDVQRDVDANLRLSRVVVFVGPNRGGVLMPAKVTEEECVACGACVEICPVEAITVDDVAKINEEECTDCGSCVEECPQECIELE